MVRIGIGIGISIGIGIVGIVGVVGVVGVVGIVGIVGVGCVLQRVCNGMMMVQVVGRIRRVIEDGRQGGWRRNERVG